MTVSVYVCSGYGLMEWHGETNSNGIVTSLVKQVLVLFVCLSNDTLITIQEFITFLYYINYYFVHGSEREG